MPDYHEFDYAVINKAGSVKGLVEIKNRKADAAKYPTIILSMSKVIAAKQWNDQGIRCFLAVRVGKGSQSYRHKPNKTSRYKVWR